MMGFVAHAQTAASYTFSRTTGTYTSISGTGTLFTSINTDDGAAGGIPLGFTFTYCGTPYSTVAACSNGWFSLANYTTVGSLGPSSSYVTPGRLMPYWGDNHGGYGTSNCYYQTTGSVGSRVFTFEWNNWTICCTGSPGYGQNYQIKLFEGSNIIQFCYGLYTTNASGRTIGIGNSTTDYLTLPNETSTTATTSFSTSCQLPPNGTILQWALCNSVLTGAGTPFCPSTSTTITSSIPGGVWTSATPAVATIGSSSGIVTGVSGGTATISYAAPCGVTVTKVVTVYALPAVPSGNTPVCVNASINLTDASGPGTWASSNAGIASVDASSGVVTGVSPGTATITFSLTSTGCQSSTIVTVNALPGAITSTTTQVCPGNTITLSDTTAGGTWSSSDNTLATVGTSSGIVTGVAAGIAVITFTAPVTGCGSVIFVTVNPLPSAIVGSTPVCPGATITLGNATPGGGTWVSSAPSIATINPATGVVTGVTNGTAAITFTATNTGCITTSSVSVNPAPAPITGINSACVGFSTTLSDATPGGNWSSTNGSQASIGAATGVVSAIAAGTPTIAYTLLGSGCKATILYTVNPLPAAISGITSLCIGSTTTLSDISSGGTWSSASTGIATIGAASGVVSGLLPGTTVVTYTLPTGCTAGAIVYVNPLPTAYAVTGGGNYCVGTSGVHIGLAYGSSGITYQLYNGITPVGAPQLGSNAGIDFGLQTGIGTYTVIANNPATGCSNIMSGSTTVGTIAQPSSTISVTGGGNFCVGGAGLPIGTDGSEGGVTYQLFNGASAVGAPVAGTGAPLSFGLFSASGNYTVTGTNASGCSSVMTGSAIITINPLPLAYAVSGGGHYCSGGTGQTISLSSSDPGNSYQVYLGGAPVGPALLSTGGALTFGPYITAGVYTIKGIDGSTACVNTMSGSATIVVDPLPVVYNVTGGGNYCFGGTGLHVGLSYSTTGIDYQLTLSGSGVISTIHGSGSGLDFGIQSTPGTYTVAAVNPATGCNIGMTGSAVINVNPLPLSYSITGGGNYCVGSPGVSIGLNLSEISVRYQLYRGVTPVGPLMNGTGSSLNFGVYTAPGTYTVIATSTLTGCAATQSGTATVTVNPLPVVRTVTGGGNYCSGGLGSDVMLSTSDLGVIYELYLGGVAQGILLAGNGTALDFGPQTTPGVYTVVASDGLTGCTRLMAGSATIGIYSLPTAFNVNGGGNYCSGGTGVHIGLDGTTTGISYRLQLGSTLVGTAMPGSGGPLDFGPQTGAGTYNVIATNILTGCTFQMSGTASIIINPAPTGYAISGGASYCAGTGGVDITIAGSDEGVHYQLYRGVTPVGPSVAGTGTILDFGFQTIAGVYTVRATDDITGCSKNMPGSAAINVIAPTVYAVTGGGNYCAGGTGVHVGQGGSSASASYQLLKDGLLFGGTVTGTGSALDFGLQTVTGAYRVVATDLAYGCIDTMAGTVNVGINQLPVAYNVTGGGSYCAGGPGRHVGLDSSNSGFNYQLYNGSSAIGTAVAGSGFRLDFGSQTGAGSYTVIATKISTLCASKMTDSATITINPVPAAYITSVTGPNPTYPGYYCAADSGVHVYLPSSDAAVMYQLWRGATMIGSAVRGTGSMLDLGLQNVAGTYTVIGTDTAAVPGCSNNMLGSATVHIVNLPDVHNVTGGGSFCRGGAGVTIGLDGSQSGYYYELFDGTVSQGLLYGTGGVLDFGLQTAVGNYTIIGNNQITTCMNNMFGSATIAYDSVPHPNVTINAYPGNGIGVWHVDSIRVFVTSGDPTTTYQWYINGNLIPGATNASFTNHEFFNRDSVACIVTAHTPCGNGTTRKSMIISLDVEGINTIGTAAGDIKLIPNPNKGAFILKGNTGSVSDEHLSIEIVDMLGRVVYNSEITSRNGNINEHIEMNNKLANGMYILNMRSADRSSMFHFVVEQ
jgi:uncharacterized protein YjdB